MNASAPAAPETIDMKPVFTMHGTVYAVPWERGALQERASGEALAALAGAVMEAVSACLQQWPLGTLLVGLAVYGLLAPGKPQPKRKRAPSQKRKHGRRARRR